MAQKTGDTILNDWKETLDNFYNKATEVLSVVRLCKSEVEQMKVELLNQINNGQFITDDNCIVISAPRIIIGNVTKDGNLKAEAGEIIIKGNALNLDGVGEGGSITMRAPTIMQKAVDPDIDGNGEVVYGNSTITQQARSVIIDSHSPLPDNDRGGTFLPALGGEGVTISSEKGIAIKAALENEEKKKKCDEEKNRLKSLIEELKNGQHGIVNTQVTISEDIRDMDHLMASEKDLTADRDLTKTNIVAIDELNYRLKKKMPEFYQHLLEYAEKVSKLAEYYRQYGNMCLEAEETTSTRGDYKKKSTDARLTLQSERIELHAVDGDGNWRTNPESAIDIRGNEINLRSLVEKEALADKEAKSRITLQSRNIDLNTYDLTDPTYDEGELKSGKFQLEGNVTINSKNITLEAIDKEQTDKGKFKETKLTDGSQINLRAQKVKVKTINEKGESVGKFSVNSQKISMKSTDIDGYKADLDMDDQGNVKRPDKMKSKGLTQGSEMLLLAETMNIGYKKKDMSAQDILIASTRSTTVGSDDSLMAFGKKSGLVMDNDAQLVTEGKCGIAGKGGIEVEGETTLKAKLTGTDIVGENLTAKTAVKAPNIGDGVVVEKPTVVSAQAPTPKKKESNI